LPLNVFKRITDIENRFDRLLKALNLEEQTIPSTPEIVKIVKHVKGMKC
jgi:hypothetical protein